MEENKHCADGPTGRPKCACGVAPFIAGVIVALAFGWWVFPGLVFSKKPQPFHFSHAAHVETAGLACDSCHSFRADGSFAGLPKLENCSSCHADVDSMQTSPDKGAAYETEKAFIKEYVATGKEVPWVVHQKQPDNVFFSHAAHFAKCYKCHLTMQGKYNLGSPKDPQRLCMTCHPSLAELDKNIPVERNMLSNYSSTTLKMWQCEHCHAHPAHFYNDGKGRTAANNACFTCHK